MEGIKQNMGITFRGKLVRSHEHVRVERMEHGTIREQKTQSAESLFRRRLELSCETVAWTRRSIRGPTWAVLFSARETVARLTPATLAISCRVILSGIG